VELRVADVARWHGQGWDALSIVGFTVTVLRPLGIDMLSDHTLTGTRQSSASSTHDGTVRLAYDHRFAIFQ